MRHFLSVNWSRNTFHPFSFGIFMYADLLFMNSSHYSSFYFQGSIIIIKRRYILLVLLLIGGI